MKPIKLTIEGINSFFDRQVIDLRFDGLFCICGDTGSGKTTILDSIIIALYGSTKRTQSITEYINLRSDKAEIRLEFEAEVDGRRMQFEVVRLIGKTANKARLICLTTGVTLAEQTEKVNAAIMEMIGLSRDDFTQVVILEQGKFGRFLSASKKERNNTVGNLFKFNKYRDLGKKATALLSRSKEKLDELSDRLVHLEAVTQSAISDTEKRITGAKKRITELKTSEDKLAEKISVLEQVGKKFIDSVNAEKEFATKKVELDETAKQLAEATDMCKRLSDELEVKRVQKNEATIKLAKMGEFKRLLGEVKKREDALTLLRDEWQKADREAKDIKSDLDNRLLSKDKLLTALSEGKEELFSIAELGDADASDLRAKALELTLGVKSARDELAALVKKEGTYIDKVRSATERQSIAMRHEADAAKRRNELKAEVERLEVELENERRLKAADYLRSALKEGDVCPVCGGTVVSKAECTHTFDAERKLLRRKSELEKAEEEYVNAKNSLFSFGTELNESTKALTAVQNERKESELRLSDVTKAIKLPDKTDCILGLATNICVLGDKLKTCENEIRLLFHNHANASSRADELLRRGENERKECDALNGEIAKSGMSEVELDETSRLEERLSSEIADMEKSVRGCEERKTALLGRLSALKASIGFIEERILSKPDFDENELIGAKKEIEAQKSERESLIASTAREERELELLKENYKAKKEIEAQKKEVKRKVDTYSDVLKLVKGDKFIEYVAEEYILQFTDAASAVLGDITSGKYSLSYHDGDFYVKDFLFGGSERKVGTLSGGETFLASLSLAIAISREIAHYKTYEFFFLDEGFGTLDERSLDTVADALVTLSSDTLVGVVTHRTELTDRIFDKLTVVAPADGSGSVVIRS